MHKGRFRPEVVALEERCLLSFAPADVRHAYGFDQIQFANSNHQVVAADGTGTTVAIVDAFDDPNVASDLAAFDQTFALPAPPSFQKVAQDGSNHLPPSAPPPLPGQGSWATEIALDVEWVHAIAPGANILLVEANDATAANLDTAVDFARSQPGVVAVSMSYGGAESQGELNRDFHFLTPASHSGGITFLSSTGDNGAPGGYQAFSPNVVAVGGTSLVLDAQGNYSSESGWSGSGGGISQFESQPGYQQGVVTQSTTQRTTPDVSFLADPATGVWVFDTFAMGGWGNVGGTSLACPMWAGLMAIANQGRALGGYSSLDGRSSTLPAIYQLPGSDFHDITSGNNGFAAGPGYDLVTGRGTPVVDQVVADLSMAPILHTNGNLMIRGGFGASADTVTLDTFTQAGATFISVTVTYGTPVPGTGSNLTYTSAFPAASVNSITISPGGGKDVVNIQSTLVNAPVTVNLGNGQDTVNIRLSTPSGISSADTLQGAVTVVGQGANDTVNINDQADAFNDTYTIGTTGSSTTVQRDFSALVTCNAVTSLVVNGGPGAKGGGITYDVNNTLFGTPVTINAGAGNDVFNVLMASPNGIFSSDNLQGPLTIHGNGGTDVLNVNDQADAFNGDQYTITSTTVQRTAEAAITYDTIESMVINGASSSSVGITYNVQSLYTFTPITINGGGGIDTLIGTDRGNLWYLTGPNHGYSLMPNTASGYTTVTFNSMENLTGGSGSDNFQFQPGASLSGALNGGGGLNNLDYSTYITTGTAGVTVNLATGTATATGSISNFASVYGSIGNDSLTGDANANSFYSYGGNDSMMGGGGNDFFSLNGETAASTTIIDGGSGTDTIQGTNISNTWKLTGLGAGSVNGVTFSNVENLAGGTNPDVFQFSPGGSVSGTVNGGSGTNTLDYSQYIATGAAGVTVNLATGTATATGGVSHIQNIDGSRGNDTLTGDANANTIVSNGGNDVLMGGAGNDTFYLYGETATSNTTIDGGTGNDTVEANDMPNTWQLTGPGSGSVNAVTFSNIESVIGGLNTDDFVFHPGASISGLVNGNRGVNTVDYSAFTTGVVVNLGLSATHGWGSATDAGGIAYIQNVTGGSGNDILVGDANANVLNGGGGRNLIIGGAGADTVIGGSGDDLLIAGYTSYDLNAAALQAILTEWQRTDESYAARVANLRSGVGAGSYRLVLNTPAAAGTVFDDGAADVLTGNAGMDWFWANLPQDTITDRAPGELVN
jgi:Ca2+-binding RTX toxin-like protein